MSRPPRNAAALAALVLAPALALAAVACDDGSSAQRLVSGIDVAFVAVDDTSVYWTECAPASCGTDGTIKLLPKPSARGALPDTVGAGRHLAAVGGTLYWSRLDGTVSRRDADGTVAALFERENATETAFAHDGKNAYEALTIAGAPLTWEIWAIPLDGAPPALVASEPSDALPFAVASDGTDVYFSLGPRDASADTGEIRRVPVASGASATLVSGAPRPLHLRVDAYNVYWTSGPLVRAAVPAAPPGRIFLTPKAGGATLSLADIWGDGGLAVDARALYWAGPANNYRVALARIPLDGSDPVTLVAWPGSTSTDMAVDADYAYWTVWGVGTDSGLVRALKH